MRLNLHPARLRLPRTLYKETKEKPGSHERMNLPVVPVPAVPFGVGAALVALALAGVMTAAWLLRRNAASRGAARKGAGEAPLLRRADAHPDAPPRPPLLAMRDLGTPFLEVRAGETKRDFEAPAATQPKSAPVERALPRDLSQPLAAFDPDAIPDVPLAPAAKLPSLRPGARTPAYAASDAFGLLRLVPAGRPGAQAGTARDERITRPETEASIHALLDRLEHGMIRHGLASGMERTPTVAHRSPSDRRRTENALDNSLATLRNLARSA
jgi:hypothetical protein